jgi:excisionase family DNA binding protein
MGKPPASEFVAVVDAAKTLGVTTRQVRNLCENGTLPATKVGRDWIIKRSDLVSVPKIRKPGPKPTSD